MVHLVPVDHDPFAEQPAAGRPKITVTPAARQPQFVPVDHDPFAERQPKETGVAEDVVRAIPSGLAKGAIDLVGLPNTVSQLWATLGDKLLDVVEGASNGRLPKGWAEETKKYIAIGRQHSAMAGLPSAAGIRKTVESNVTGPLYEPQMLPGKFAGTVAEMVPGAGRRLITQALMPGVAAETAGQVAERAAPEYAPLARGVGAVAGGVAGIPFARANSAEAAVRKNMTGALDDATIARASALMDDAANRGVQLTWAEALEQVAPGTGLVNLQRTIEGTREGREVLAPVMAQRAGQMDAAARQSFDTVAPVNPNPSGIGPQVADEATGILDGTRAAINRHTRPLYQAAEAQRIAPATFAHVSRDPVFQEGLQRVRSDPWIGPTLRGLPDDSVAVIDAIKKQLSETGDALRSPTAGTARSNFSASIIDQGVGRMVRAADEATGSRPGVMGTYETARAQQEVLRAQYLEPLLQGPLGKLAERSPETRNAIDALFPKQALPNSEQEITTAVRALAGRNHRATMDLIRTYTESVFDQAAKNVQQGGNQFGAANFAAALSGQQRANLRAAIEASGPGGSQIWQGFERFLEMAEASGKRLREGSPTAGRLTEIKDLSSGGAIANSAKTGASPSKWLSVVSDAWSRWQLGGNVNEIARLLVDNGARNRLRAIASVPQGSESAWRITAHLARNFVQGHFDSRNELNQPGQK